MQTETETVPVLITSERVRESLMKSEWEVTDTINQSHVCPFPVPAVLSQDITDPMRLTHTHTHTQKQTHKIHIRTENTPARS